MFLSVNLKRITHHLQYIIVFRLFSESGPSDTRFTAWAQEYFQKRVNIASSVTHKHRLNPQTPVIPGPKPFKIWFYCFQKKYGHHVFQNNEVLELRCLLPALSFKACLSDDIEVQTYLELAACTSGKPPSVLKGICRFKANISSHTGNIFSSESLTKIMLNCMLHLLQQHGFVVEGAFNQMKTNLPHREFKSKREKIQDCYATRILY